MKNEGRRINRESGTVSAMIDMYCRGNHAGKGLCAECEELINYSRERLSRCPYGEGKTTCARCPVHCYKPDMREKIRTVMRYSGPRMIYRHPIMAIRHFIDGRRNQPISGETETRL